MALNITSVVIGSICLACAVGYVIARWKDANLVAALAKAIASTAFVVLAVVNGASETGYGRLILAALVFSWAGDMLLLSLRSNMLLAGIGSFFVAHIIYAAAFTIDDLNPNAFFVAFAASAIFGSLVLKWLWKYLKTFIESRCRFILPPLR